MNNIIFLGIECVKVLEGMNGLQFVCNARCMKNGQVYSNVGVGGNIQEAQNNAKKTLSDMMNTSSSSGNNYDKDYHNKTYPENNKSKLNGGGNKPISEGQIKCLQSIASKKGLNINDLTQNQYGKDLFQLVGSQAHDLIKSLTGGQ